MTLPATLQTLPAKIQNAWQPCTLRDGFDKPESEGMLLIDATNAFNSLIRKLALENIKVVCPSLLIPLKNSSASPGSLFVNGTVILSQEGTTQGDPLAMTMYGIALLPLVKLLKNTDVVQKWYADDGNAVGKLKDLHRPHDALTEHCPGFGYHITKCHIIAEKNHLENPKEIFKNKDGHFGRPSNTRIGHRQRICLSRFQNKSSVRARKNHFQTRTARQNSPSECTSSVYQRYANQIVLFNPNNTRHGRVPASPRN